MEGKAEELYSPSPALLVLTWLSPQSLLAWIIKIAS
jgi:hypothetical protein